MDEESSAGMASSSWSSRMRVDFQNFGAVDVGLVYSCFSLDVIEKSRLHVGISIQAVPGVMIVANLLS